MLPRLLNLCLLLGAMVWADSSRADWREFDETEATDLVASIQLDTDRSDFVVREADGSVVVDVPVGQSANVPLGVFPIEGMESETYALQLLVDHNLSGSPAYFEMWTSLNSGGQFFSKTLATRGLMAHLDGVVTDRDVLIPASLEGSSETASKCSLAIVLPSGGQVTIRKARMLDLPAGLSIVTSVPGQWFPSWFGGVLGGVFGVIAGCLGSFYAYSCRSGMMWSTMQYFPIVLGVVGGVVLLAGVAALVVRQPYHVWYPLMLLGVIALAVAPAIRWQTQRQFASGAANFEDRRMQAMDA